MLHTLVVVLSVLAWGIQAHNGTSSEIIDNSTSMNRRELGSSERESENVTRALSSESERTSSERTSSDRTSSDRTSSERTSSDRTSSERTSSDRPLTVTVRPRQITTLLNDRSSESRRASVTESHVNGLTDISSRNTVTERPSRSLESEDSGDDDSDEMRSSSSSGSHSAKRDSRHGLKEQRRSLGTTSKIGTASPLRSTSSNKENRVTEIKPRATQLSSSEESTKDIRITHAFSVGEFGLYQLPINGSPIRFTKIFFNEAQIYNKFTGKFTIRVSGVYSLAYSMHVPQNPNLIDLYVNGIPVISNVARWTENSGVDSASLILRLKSRDQIWFAIAVNNDEKKIVRVSLTFSGSLLSC